MGEKLSTTESLFIDGEMLYWELSNLGRPKSKTQRTKQNGHPIIFFSIFPFPSYFLPHFVFSDRFSAFISYLFISFWYATKNWSFCAADSFCWMTIYRQTWPEICLFFLPLIEFLYRSVEFGNVWQAVRIDFQRNNTFCWTYQNYFSIE